jgi:hypothetical protein
MTKPPRYSTAKRIEETGNAEPAALAQTSPTSNVSYESKSVSDFDSESQNVRVKIGFMDEVKIIKTDIENLAKKTGVSVVPLAQFILSNSSAQNMRGILYAAFANLVGTPSPVGEAKKTQPKSERRTYPDRAIQRLVIRYRAAAEEFGKLPADSAERLVVANTLVNAFETLKRRGFPVDDLPARDELREARRIKRAHFRAQARASAPP